MSDNHCWAKGLLLPFSLSLPNSSLFPFLVLFPLHFQSTPAAADSNDRHIMDVISGNFYFFSRPLQLLVHVSALFVLTQVRSPIVGSSTSGTDSSRETWYARCNIGKLLRNWISIIIKGEEAKQAFLISSPSFCPSSVELFLASPTFSSIYMSTSCSCLHFLFLSFLLSPFLRTSWTVIIILLQKIDSWDERTRGKGKSNRKIYLKLKCRKHHNNTCNNDVKRGVTARKE